MTIVCKSCGSPDLWIEFTTHGFCKSCIDKSAPPGINTTGVEAILEQNVKPPQRFQACYGPNAARAHIADMETSATTRLTLCQSTGVVGFIRGQVRADALCQKCCAKIGGDITAAKIGVAEIC